MLKKINLVTLYMLLFVAISCQSQQEKPKVQFVDNYEVTKEVVVDSTAEISKMIENYKQGLKNTMNEVVGHSKMDMPKNKPESLLSNMVADFTCELGREYCKKHKLSYSVDGAIINIGGLRKAMPKGEITLGDIYEISPFENKLYIVAMYGKDLRKLFDHITRSGGEGVGNIRLKANSETKKLKETFIAGKPLDDEKLYHVISIDYLINGGDGMVAFSKNIEKIDMKLKSRDALLEYVKAEEKAGRPLQSKLDKRISYE